MKLTPTPISLEPTTSASKSTSTSPPAPQVARYNQLQQLVNTWAKVESSQVLDPAQSQKALADLQARLPSSPTATENPKSDQPQPKLKQDQILALIQLNTAKGLMSILSQQVYDKGSMLLIKQNSQGQWQLQSPAQAISLTALSHQFKELGLTSSTMALLNSQQAQGKSTAQATWSTPAAVLHSETQVNGTQVKKAMNLSGQFFENQLLKKPAHEKNPSIIQENSTKTQSTQPFNINESLKKVESQLNKWIQALPVQLKSSQVNKENSMQPTLPAQEKTKNSAQQITHSVSKSATSKNSNSPSNTTDNFQQGQNKTSINDGKAWLIQLQKQLFKDWQQQSNAAPKLAAQTNNPISKQLTGSTQVKLNPALTKPLQPWIDSVMAKNETLASHSSNATTTTAKTSIKPDQLLEWLLNPKPPSSEKSLSIWPSNLSAQHQIHKLLQNMMLNMSESQNTSSQEPEKILRQLLQVSQSLSRLQGEQVNNRLSQIQQPENLQLNFSIPYMHQQNMHWCELELSQKDQEESSKKGVMGWHMVLRFAQEDEGAFAIESFLSGQQLQLTLWAQQQSALANLSKHSGLLRRKLKDAGFQVDNIQSKRGTPTKNTRQVHQSMIDVHT